MDREVTPPDHPFTPGQRLGLSLVRLHQRVGLAGLAGLGLLAAAAAIAGLGWRQHRTFDGQASAASARAAAALPAPRGEVRPLPTRWPSAKDIPLLLTRIERAAVEQGLGWPQADYRFNAATAEAPDSVEVRCTLKGPYPSVRRFVTSLLLDMPTLTLKEFSIGRSNADASNVDAKLAIVVYLGPAAGGDAEAPR